MSCEPPFAPRTVRPHRRTHQSSFQLIHSPALLVLCSVAQTPPASNRRTASKATTAGMEPAPTK